MIGTLSPWSVAQRRCPFRSAKRPAQSQRYTCLNYVLGQLAERQVGGSLQLLGFARGRDSHHDLHQTSSAAGAIVGRAFGYKVSASITPSRPGRSGYSSGLAG